MTNKRTTYNQTEAPHDPPLIRFSIENQVDKFWVEDLLVTTMKPTDFADYFKVAISKTSGQMLLQNNQPLGRLPGAPRDAWVEVRQLIETLQQQQ